MLNKYAMTDSMTVQSAQIEDQQPYSIDRDMWDPLFSLQRFGEHRLTSVEFTMSQLCNMRCEHCAVGDTLTMSEGERIPLERIFHILDEVVHLETISITGGEPCYSEKVVREYIIPLLTYARKRGLKSQLNSNLTLDYDRYEALAEVLDVMHISFNYTNADDYYEIGFGRSDRHVSHAVAARLYEQMIDNARRLSDSGLFVSAESMINYRTHENIQQIHQQIIDMGCQRHEVHPMYPSSFAANLPMLSLDDIRAAIHRLLDAHQEHIWLLFGTLPFYHCSHLEEDQSLLKRLQQARQVTVRNDPDGRNRMNVNLFTGDVYVTDFSNMPAMGNVLDESLDHIFTRWMAHPLFKQINCYCPQVSCCGPNPLVANAYYPDIDFTTRQAIGG